jgi:hypothetical protein
MHVYMYTLYHAVCKHVSITRMIREKYVFYLSAFVLHVTNQSAKKLTDVGGYVCKASVSLFMLYHF